MVIDLQSPTNKIILESNIYTLSENAFEDYNLDKQEQNELENKVKTLLEDKIKNYIGDVEEEYLDRIVCNFFNLLDKTFEAYGSHMVRLFTNDNFDINDLRNYSGFGKLFNEEVLNLIPIDQHDQIKTVFNTFFFESTSTLYSITKICHHVLSQTYTYCRFKYKFQELVKFTRFLVMNIC